MSAALVDLVSVGAQDAYITGEPQVSFGAKTTNVTRISRSSQSEWITSVLSMVVLRLSSQSVQRVTF